MIFMVMVPGQQGALALETGDHRLVGVQGPNRVGHLVGEAGGEFSAALTRGHQGFVHLLGDSLV